jgi:hypothetical protein
MLDVTRRTGMGKKHVIGGSGIIDTIAGFIKRITTSNAAKTIASNISKAATTDIGKTVLNAAKTAGKELALAGINTVKDVTIAKGKQLINKGSKKALTPQSVQTIQQLTGLAPSVPVLTQRSKDVLTSLVNNGATVAETNINRLLGSGMKSSKAVAIQDLVRQMNGSGLKLAVG